ncbi:hypothetical protein MC64_000045 [Aeromonas caviae]|uniref:VCBS domain-containing protein n=1 Tax=Aeromonas caviae TaxID=648 RepID=UPI000C9DEDA5|nr:VCBS domain-containing protein [Aeromonas caviae]PNO54039.1 hypothetical protein MC64_000045 [Aeromonas caviae]
MWQRDRRPQCAAGQPAASQRHAGGRHRGDAGEDKFIAGTLDGKYGQLVLGADGKWTYSADNGQAAIQG